MIQFEYTISVRPFRPYPLQFQQQRSIEFHFTLGDRFDGHNHALDTPKEKRKKRVNLKWHYIKVNIAAKVRIADIKWLLAILMRNNDQSENEIMSRAVYSL